MKLTIKQLLITIAVLLCSVVVNAHDFVVDGIYYNITSAENLIVSVTYKGDYSNSYSDEYSGNVAIPEKVIYQEKTYNVTSIGVGAFLECSSLTSITIPNSVTSIGVDAFYYCSNLTSVNISDIAAWCNINFDNYSSNPVWYSDHGNLYLNGEKVTNLVIPEGVDSIKNYAFCGGECITSVTIPNSVTYIGRSAFENCNSISSITIPNSVTYIGKSAFEDCNSLISVTIPNSVTYIGERAFNGCDTLLNVNISDITAWCNIDFANWFSNPARNLYLNGEKITNLIIPEGVDSIKDYAFYSCDCITSVTIPNSVTYIGEMAFEYCNSLTSVTIPNSVIYIGSWAFIGCDSLTSITWNVKNYPHSCSDIFPTSITSFTFGDNVEHIPDYLCQDMSKLTSITIGNNVTSIGEWAFENCNNLRTIQIGESIKTIEKGAFAGCTALYSISVDAIIPPIIDKTTFTDVSRTAQIKVPCNAVAAYQASNYWNEFTNYIETPYSLIVVSNDNTMGNAIVVKQPTCQDITAQVQAQALPGYEFVKWSDGFTENPHTIFVTSDTTITAEFRVASTPVENIFNSQISFYTTDGTLHIEGVEGDYQIYTTTGQCVYSGKETTLTLPRGIYLITINGKTDKLHVK